MKDFQNSGASKPVAAALQSQTNPPCHILVVEDDIAIRNLNREVLIHSGYQVDVAEDGAEAWEALRAGEYDLMITDNSMPKVSGVELLKKLRAARMSLPVIMATGVLPEAEFSRQPWLRPAATVLKPYTVEDLLQMVKKVLREVDATPEGSQLSMDLGLKDNPLPPSGKPAGASSAAAAKSVHRILVVDEDRDLRQMYTEALAGLDFHVDVAEDGAAAWEALQNQSYQLLITEHDVPHLTGVQLVRRMRAARMALPVIMAAARLPIKELGQNPSLQLAATLEKPFEVAALVGTVKNALGASIMLSAQQEPAPNRPSPPSAGGLQG